MDLQFVQPYYLFRVLIENEDSKAFLRPMLPQIIGEYFRIMDEAENESILSALQVGYC
jgi:hypothetical protein